MKSRTKYKLDKEIIAKLFQKAEIDDVKNIIPLGAGEFNSVYSADSNGINYVIKIAPIDSDRILTYEKNIMEQELYFYSIMKELVDIRVPKIYFWDFSKKLIPVEYFIMERMEGKQIDLAQLSDEQRKDVEKKLIEMVARMHSVKGEKFGYRQNELHANWHFAIESMVKNLIGDCNRLGRKTKRGKKLSKYIDTYKYLLEEVECSLINFDIWPANIFCNIDSGEINLSWIDPERCLWGDKIADFVCLDFMNMSFKNKTKVLENYNNVSDEPINSGHNEIVRFAIMLGYLALVMEVEKYARYSFLNFGYWRNVFISKTLYKNAFKQLVGVEKNN